MFEYLLVLLAKKKKKLHFKAEGNALKYLELNYRFPQIKHDVFLVSARTTDWFCQEIPMPNAFLVIRGTCGLFFLHF